MSQTLHPAIRQTVRHWWRKSQHTVSLTVVYICTATFVLVAFADILRIVDRRVTISILGLSYSGVFERGWLFQFVTAPFLHANITHLLFNMLAIWMLGPSVEKKLGKRGYINLSVISAVSAMVAFLIANWGTGHLVVGYSGVIFGIFVAQAKFFPEHRIIIFYFFPMKMRHAVLVLAAVELYLTISPEHGVVSHISHLFGAVGAYVYLMLRQKRFKQVPRKRPKKKTPAPVEAIRKTRVERKVPRRL